MKGEIKIGFDRVFGATSSWEINYCWVPITNTSFVCNPIRTETDGGGLVCDGISNTRTSRALLRPGRFLEQVRFKETTTSEKFSASIKYDFGWMSVF